jgi:SAM-dependent MidA family methyltransferase
MELALYAPDLGYYSGGAAKLGKAGDFTTAPEMSPLFGAALAQAAAAIIAQSAPNILEFGAGTGKLARDVLTELAQPGCGRALFIVELSGELRARQQEALRDFPQVRWLDAFPAPSTAWCWPTRCSTRCRCSWSPRRRRLAAPDAVTVAEGASPDYLAPADAALLAQIARQVPDARRAAGRLPDRGAPVACGFMASLARMLRNGRGAAILFDYGFPAHEYYLGQRAAAR